MTTSRRLYFTLYVNCRFKWYVSRHACRARVVHWIASAAGGQISGPLGDDVKSACIEYCVNKNDEYSWKRSQQGDQDAFLYSRFLVEAEAIADSVTVDAYLAELRKVVAVLESEGAAVIAAGDYEKELIRTVLED